MSDGGVPIGLQVLTVTVWSVGVPANAFFLALLWRHVRGWPLGKTLLFMYHIAAVAFLLILAIPAVIALATPGGLSPAQCAPVMPIFHYLQLFIPLSLGLSAVLRWRVVRSSALGGTLSSAPPAAPRAPRYVLGLVGVVLLLAIASAVSARNLPARWSFVFMACLQVHPFKTMNLMLCLTLPIPVMIYYYRKIIKAFRAAMGDKAPNQDVKHMVRLFIVLSVTFYCTYLPFIVLLVLISQQATVPLIVGPLFSLLQTSYSTASPILSIVLTPRYWEITRAIFARKTVYSHASTPTTSSESPTKRTVTEVSMTSSTAKKATSV